MNTSGICRPIRLRRLGIALVVLLAFPWSQALLAGSADALAERILESVGRPVGLAHLPRCGDGSLALALVALDQNLRLHGQDADYACVQAARKKADEAGWFGRRVWFDQGVLQRLLPAGRSADLVVLADLRADELTRGLAAEIRRVLHPWYGVAVLGNTSGAMDPEALREWASSISPGVTPVPGEGPLVKVRAEALAGADDWPQAWHGPDNNAASRDTAFELPSTMQWTGKPYFAPTRLELPIVAGGRLFMLWNGYEMDSARGVPMLAESPEGDGPILMAQAVGSGARLWMRRLSPACWVQVSRSIFIADGEQLLVADGNRILELDAATGRILRQPRLDTPEIKWMALHRGRVFVLGGSVTKSFGHRSAEAVVPFRSSGLHLIALDRQSLQPLWRVDRQAGMDAFDPRSPAIDGDRLFICTEEDTAEAWSVESGQRLWQAEAGFERMQIQGYEWDRSSRHPVTGYAMLGVYVISGTEMSEAVVLSQEDGTRLWTAPTPRHHQAIPLAFQERLWLGSRSRDLVTGDKENATSDLLKESCSRATYAPFLKYANYSPTEPLKSNCFAGTLVANGLLWKFPSPCTACTEWRGFTVQSAREALPAAGGRRLWGERVAPAGAAKPNGWLTYRGDARRSFSTATKVASEAKILWISPAGPSAGPVSQNGAVMMDAEIVPTPPLVADERVIVARTDGSVEALDLARGQRLWRAYTSGRIHSCPAVWRDRVLVGSADGYLYAFALDDGRELWRLRIAPRRDRIMVYEQLGSRWPVLGSPIVYGDRVAISAGLVGMVDGVHAVCANVVDGKVLWERSDWTDAEACGKISGGAQFALCDDLFYHGGMGPVIRIDPESGVCRPAFPAGAGPKLGKWNVKKWKTVKAFDRVWGYVKGQEVGVLSPRWIVYGGRRIFTDQAEHGAWRNTVKILGRDAEGSGRLPAIDVKDCSLMPAWDERDVLFYSDVIRTKRFLVMIPRQKLIETLEGLMPGHPTDEILAMDDAKPQGAITIPPELLSAELKASSEELIRWKSEVKWTYDLQDWLLAEDAVLAVRTRWKAKHGPDMLVCLSREDGSMLWEVELPARPVHGGMAVAADGSVVLALVDGRTLRIGAAQE